MKKLFVSVLAIAGLVACNNEETLFQQGPAAIEFEASHVEKATRVDPSITTETLAGFDVWAYMDSKEGKVLFGEDVTKNGGKWGYADTQYWMPGHDYFFTAIAPMNSGNWNYAYEADTIAFTNVDGTEDLLLALAEADTHDKTVDYDYETVKLTFDHLLSKTKFTFKNGFTSKYVTVEVKDVKMTADAQAATYDVNARAWGESAGEVVLAYGNVPVMAAGVKNEATDERLTIPAVKKEYTVEFDIYVYQGENAGIEKFHKTSTIENVVLEQGKAYNFVATISPETLGLDEIEFEVIEVNEWIYAGEDKGQIEEAELKAALQLGGEVVLAKDYVITSPLYVTENVTLNLNGHAISNKVDNAATDVIVVAEGATLTIEGEGTIEAVSGNDGYAIIADGTVVINGGTFKAGKDENGEANAVVYVRGEGKAFVNGGYFPNENASNYVLNKKDSNRSTTTIEVRGGKFVGFDPADNAAEYPAESFVVEGYYSSEVEANVFVVSDALVVATSDALAAAVNGGAKKVYLMEGTYSLAKYPAGLELVGCEENVVLDVQGKAYGVNGDIAFENVKLVYSNANYKGFQHTNVETYKNCTIVGQPFLYGNKVTFEGCTFEQESANAYNIWTYGAKEVEFVNCKFYSAGKSVLIYAESSSNGQTALFEGCELYASAAVEGKAAIEIDSSLIKGAYDITINNTTATGFANGNVSGNSLWNNKKGDKTTITVDGVQVL